MVERVSTGIPGLDEMIEGGYKKNNTILLVGGCGSGKSTMAMQYLVYGAQHGEPGIYVTFEEQIKEIKENMGRHKWDLGKLEDEGTLKLLRIDPQVVMNIVREEYGAIVDAINSLKAKRVVIDSVTSIEAMLEGEHNRRQWVLRLVDWLQKMGVTTVLISESEQDPTKYSRHGVMEFVVDGVVVLYNIRRGKTRVRALEILKMRGTDQMTSLVPYIISEGIQLQPRQMIFGDFGQE
ncbi:MAG: AAA family ATPase [Candidatus Altiarchaeota archaeon]|nr:AAA family ATPase [Candidatus Altiarchaeota archaeon]